MADYWIGVASKEHVMMGVNKGFAQLCHGKKHPLTKMKKGDWLIYYSSKETFHGKTPLQKFTAIGTVADDRIVQANMGNGFKPFRRNMNYVNCEEISIHPLIPELSFIKDEKYWDYPFRLGYVKISKKDFQKIASGMIG